MDYLIMIDGELSYIEPEITSTMTILYPKKEPPTEKPFNITDYTYILDKDNTLRAIELIEFREHGIVVIHAE